jgi:myo-inositol 2-dehydrogenase/D-chiro-inositol 1-dehydrogenase
MTLQIGIIGTGWFGQKHASMLEQMDGVTIAAVCGSSQEKADRMASDFPNAKGYASAQSMLDDQKLDAVYICVPPFAHGEIEFSLIERGIPFLVEKPLGTTLQTPTQILEKLDEKELIHSVGYHFRYMDSTQRARQLIQERKTGMALGYWTGSMPGVYWWRKNDGSGGQFVEQTTHIVDLLRYTMGEVSEVYAAYAQQVMHEKEEGVTVADAGTVTLKMKSGVVANISNTCLLPFDHQAGLHLYTDQGVLELGMDTLKDIRQDQTTVYKNQSNPYETENKAFIHALRTGDTSGILSTYRDAWKTHQITTAANRSAQAGQSIRLD